jgi:hypothetical protein
LTSVPSPEPPAPRVRPRTAGAWLALVAGLAFAFQLPIFDRWFSFMDEGHMLLYADMIARGGELYRDATVYPLPGAFYLLALIFRVFEPSNLVARWVVVLEFTPFACVCFALLRRAVPLRYAFTGFALLLAYRIWAFPHWHMYNYSTTALLVQTSALLVLLGALRDGSLRRVALAGLLFGLGVLVKQDYGAAALLTCGSLMLLHTRSLPAAERPALPALLGSFLLPASLVGAATGLYFWHHGLLGDLLRFTVFNHFVGMSSYPYSTFPPFLPLFEQDALLRGRAASAFIPGILLTSDWTRFAASSLYRETAIVDTALKVYYWLPYLFTAFAALRLWWCRRELRDPSRRERYLVEYSLWALGASFLLLVTVNRPQDYVHLAVLYFPFLLLAVVQVHALLRGRRLLAGLLAALFLPPAALAAGYTGLLWWRIRSYHTAPIDSPRAGIYVTEDQADLFDQMLTYIRENTAPDEPVAVMPYFPLLSFYAERRGPHRSSYIVWPFPEFPDRDRRIIEAMEATGTKLVIYNFTQFTVFNLVSEYAPELYQYLVDEWEIDRVFTTEGWGYKLAALRRRKEPVSTLLTPATPVELTLRPDRAPPQPIEPEERASWARIAPWPFRETLALRPTSAGRTVLSLPLEVPPASRLHTAVSVHPKAWYHGDPAWADFELAIVDGERRETVFQRRLRPNSQKDDRGWTEVEVPLHAWSGRHVMLELSVATNKPSGENLFQAGWALPLLVSEPEVAGAG